MNNTEKYFIKLINKYINQSEDRIANDYNVSYEDVDRDRLNELIAIHRLSALIFASLDKDDVDADLYDKLQKGFFAEIAKYQKRQYVLNRMLKLFEENGIDNIVVKGCHVNQYYSNPEVRSMGDIDLLIKDEDILSVKNIFSEAGFEFLPQDSEENVCGYRINGIHIEVHSNLVSEGCIINGYDFQEYFTNPFKHVKKSKILLDDREAEHSYYLEDTYNLVYMIFHIAKHFYQSGCGVRMLIDLPFFIRKADIDFEQCVSDLKRIRLYEFSQILFGICEEWFGMESFLPGKEKNNEVAMDFMMNGGVFGYYKRNTTADKIKYMSSENGENGSYFCGMLKWAFPSPKKMRQYSDWYRNKPGILLPVAYIERMVRNVRERGGVFRVLRNVVSGKKDLDEKSVILKSVGLKQ